MGVVWATVYQLFPRTAVQGGRPAVANRAENKRRAEIALDAAKVPTPQRAGQRMAQERCSTPSLACRPRVPYRLARWASPSHGFAQTAQGTNRELKAPGRQRSESEFFHFAVEGKNVDDTPKLVPDTLKILMTILKHVLRCRNRESSPRHIDGRQTAQPNVQRRFPPPWHDFAYI